MTAQNSVFQISSPNEVTNTELRIYLGTGGNFVHKNSFLAGSILQILGGIAFRGYKGGFEGLGNETKLAAGDYVGLYNTTTNKFQGYAAGAWVDLH